MEPPEPKSSGRAARIVQGAALVVFLGSLIALGRYQATGVTHADLELDDGTPATLYLPGRVVEHWLLPDPPPPADRPPGVVVTHAFGADRATMSTLARRLARNGYAALAIDLPGHGANAKPFPVGRGRRDLVAETFEEARAFLVRSGHADPDRLAMIGHSLGAIGVLDDVAGTDRVGATVLMSVGLIDPREPPVPNLLVLYAAWDSGWMVDSALALAADQAGVDRLPPGTTRGDFAAGRAVRVQRIDGAEHFSMAVSRGAAREILAWLDASFGIRRTGPPALGDPRWIPALVALAAALVLLVGLGDVLGRLAPVGDPDGAPAGLRAGAVLAAASLLTAPILATGERLASFVGLEAMDMLLAHMAAIGALLLVRDALRGAGPIVPAGTARAVTVAALGAAATYAALAPLGVVVRRLTFTPGRLAAFLAMLPWLVLLFVALDRLLRRGSPGRAAVASVAGRVLLVVLWIVGVELRLVPPMTVVIAPLFLILLLPLEVVAWRIHRRSGNVLVTALYESLVFGWLCAVLLPSRW